MKDKTKALILIDLQNDFFPGGALGVKGAEAIIPIANRLQDRFDIVVATKDWHPKKHKSFASEYPNKSVYDQIMLEGVKQTLWPDHCVQGSFGAEFHPKLNIANTAKIIHKGTDPNIDSYSAFFDNAHKKKTDLDAYLKLQGVQAVYMMGLATDYCVQYSVLDAAMLGFKVFLIEEGCCGIEKSPGDIETAKKNMQAVGAILITSEDVAGI